MGLSCKIPLLSKLGLERIRRRGIFFSGKLFQCTVPCNVVCQYAESNKRDLFIMRDHCNIPEESAHISA